MPGSAEGRPLLCGLCRREGESVSGESNKRMIRRHYEGLWNRWHHPAVADELISADTVFRDPVGVTVRGLESCGTKNLSSHHMV